MIRTDLKKIRKTLKLTQKQLASTFGVPQSFISQIENGIDAMPAHWTPKLINMLGISDLSEYQLATTYKNQSEDIIDRLRVFFESTGLPQGRIAMQCGLTAKMLNNILRGEGKMDVSVFL
uniref:helix-turn-helix domain-containing protein n=1 Tax=uncultured Alistipes sp. TaxID=538949 RepID=UPI0025A5DEE4